MAEKYRLTVFQSGDRGGELRPAPRPRSQTVCQLCVKMQNWDTGRLGASTHGATAVIHQGAPWQCLWVIIPNAQRVVECVDNIDRVRWSLADIVPTLDGLLGLNLEPPFPGLDDIRAFRDAVWTVWAAEKEDRVWGCFLVTHCGTVFGQGREHYQQLLAKFGRVQEQAVKDAAGHLGNFMARREDSAESGSAEDEEPQEPTSESEDEAPKFFTPPQLAKEWGVDADKVLGWIRSGQLVAVNMVTTTGGRPRYRISAEEALAFQKRRSTSPPPQSSPRTKPPKDDDTIKFY